MSVPIVSFGARLMSLIGIAALSRRRLRGKLTILMYHGVESELLSPPCWHVLSTSELSRQLQYVHTHFNVLPLEEGLERLGDGTLPERAMVLTFDDGTRNLATQAAPILRKYNLPAAIFLTTGLIGTDQIIWADQLWLAFAQTPKLECDLTSIKLKRYSLATPSSRGSAYKIAVEALKSMPDSDRAVALRMIVMSLKIPDSSNPGPFQLLSWDEAKAVAREGGISLHPHSVTHPILAQCADAKVESEINHSCAMIQQQTGVAPKVFAYPNGRLIDFDERATMALQRQGVIWGLTTSPGVADGRCDPFRLPRVPIGSDLPFPLFALLVSGAFYKSTWFPHPRKSCRSGTDKNKNK